MIAETADSTLYHVIAKLHGFTGLIIFITGILQFVLKKGGKLHHVIGRTYNYSWIVIIATGVYIGSPVIVAIVLMGFYLSVTGIRLAIRQSKPYTGIDKVILAVAVLIVLFMIVSTVILILKQNLTMAIIATFFVLLYGFVLSLDIAKYLFNKRLINSKKDYGKMDWYISHLSRMEFSFVTATGAFTAVQNLFGNTILNFILPAFIGFAAVRMSRKYFLKKLKLSV